MSPGPPVRLKGEARRQAAKRCAGDKGATLTRSQNPELTASCSGAELAAVYHVGSQTSCLATVEALARTQLAARRRRAEVAFCHVPPRTQELLELCGLTTALRSVVEPCGQAEQREEPSGVEEGVHRDDLPA